MKLISIGKENLAIEFKEGIKIYRHYGRGPLYGYGILKTANNITTKIEEEKPGLVNDRIMDLLKEYYKNIN